MCTGPAFILMLPFINARCQSAAVTDIRLKRISCLSTRCGEEKAMTGTEACVPGGMSLVASHFSVAVFCCVPLQEKQIFTGPDERLRGLLHKGSGAVSCAQPR